MMESATDSSVATSARGPGGPVFARCPRCDYSLRGLPANHACPECGLRFDEQCELYRTTNPKAAFFMLYACRAARQA